MSGRRSGWENKKERKDDEVEEREEDTNLQAQWQATVATGDQDIVRILDIVHGHPCLLELHAKELIRSLLHGRIGRAQEHSERLVACERRRGGGGGGPGDKEGLAVSVLAIPRPVRDHTS